jgi:hypothetical protein
VSILLVFTVWWFYGNIFFMQKEGHSFLHAAAAGVLLGLVFWAHSIGVIPKTPVDVGFTPTPPTTVSAQR